MAVWSIHQGDVLDVLSTLPSDYFHASLSDPPYGLSFMGRQWDHGVPSSEVYAEILRALKPGAPLLHFGGTRTYHRLTCSIEDAGFEIRDCLMWVYGSGFPKSHNISKAIDKAAGAERGVVGKYKHPATGKEHGDFRTDNDRAALSSFEMCKDSRNITAPATPQAAQWEGYGTALKPAYEPVVMGMKPTDGTFANNALVHGVAGLNVDGGRVEGVKRSPEYREHGSQGPTQDRSIYNSHDGIRRNIDVNQGRFPANLLHDGSPDAIEGMGDKARYFYCAKASKSERNAGVDANRHPCVKPLDLIRYLATLILPPPGDTPRRILVPYSGSGSEMIGCLLAGWDEVVGIEIDPAYIDIAHARIEHWVARGAA